ncbi:MULTISPECIES: hypothetical protein [Cellulophaga]|uniref:Kazal-like domain-containing protein n=1 Tax=Cellulophaga geojensis KL-A TaxID=1328323 RepID=A0ABN0RKV3_9FLAO|nr:MULTISPECIES: hypothetical protein [Cellulophaga]EWH12455.1 hypothetical protein KLA_14423 [Cellulophaga geojensis KL-A]SNQ42724.1 exported hypothetical protein [Cellulophaga lytica]
MKNISKFILAPIIVVGAQFSSDAQVNLSPKNTQKVIRQAPDCSSFFAACDNTYPNSFSAFDECMRRNGCKFN